MGCKIRAAGHFCEIYSNELRILSRYSGTHSPKAPAQAGVKICYTGRGSFFQ